MSSVDDVDGDEGDGDDFVWMVLLLLLFPAPGTCSFDD